MVSWDLWIYQNFAPSNIYATIIVVWMLSWIRDILTGELDSLLPSLKEAINALYHKLFGLSAVPVQYHTPSTTHQRSCDHNSFQTASGITTFFYNMTLIFA